MSLSIFLAFPTDDMREHDTVFGAFQLRLIELRREMEGHVALLDDREDVAKRAWLAYKEATS